MSSSNPDQNQGGSSGDSSASPPNGQGPASRLQQAELAEFTMASSYQLMAQAITLAMQNAVAQQQHAYTLLNAITTSAADAIFNGKTEEAEQAIRLSQQLLSPEKTLQMMDELMQLAKRLEQEFGDKTESVIDKARNTTAPRTKPKAQRKASKPQPKSAD
ncbi:MAG: hypothetical protein Tsb002_37560 [Wenzhouxiangellaceae bacterium]